MAEIGSKIGDRYVILEEIGKGGMSTVYLARDQRLNQRCAIKEIRKYLHGKTEDEIIIDNLLEEAELMKKLNHPALSHIVDVIDETNTILVIMDYIEGRSLDKVLEESGAQPEEQVLKWARQICDAVDYLHSKQPTAICRKIKPSNIMLTPNDDVIIADYGIVDIIIDKYIRQGVMVIGVNFFGAPELYKEKFDMRSHVYSLGMTMYALLTGVCTCGMGEYRPVRQHDTNLSKEIEWIIDCCVQFNPEQRYQNCQELKNDLDHLDLVSRKMKKQRGWFRIFFSSFRDVFR